MPGIRSAGLPLGRAIVWTSAPLAAMTCGSVIVIGDKAKPASASGRPSSRRPKVASWTFSWRRVP